MVELVDTPDLGSGAARCVGSSPILGITERFVRNDKMFGFFMPEFPLKLTYQGYGFI